MSDTDLVKLYSGQILQLAGSIPNLGRLEVASGSAKLRAPLCGSSITVDVGVENGQITRFAQEVRACALGQASASVLGRVVIGRTRAQVQAARDGVASMLKDGAATPPAPFDGYEVLRAASGYQNRHASILLALDATLAAMDAAAQ